MARARAKRKLILVDTQLAALYLLMAAKPNEKVQSFNESEIRRAKTRIYNAARDGKITRHGGKDWGSAQWDLAEVHSLLQPPAK